MSGDQNFPFPEPSFLFIHEATWHQYTDSETDVRGVQRNVYLDTPIKGYLTAPDAQAEEDAGGLRVRIGAVFITDNGTDVVKGDFIECDDPQLPPDLAGLWRVDVARSTISHRRCLLVRHKAPWGEQS